MSAARLVLAACALVVVVLARTPRAAADRAAAEFFVQRGERALRERKWAEARDHFEKALGEYAEHLPARLGLAEARYGSGDRAGALEAWRAVAAAPGADLPPGWPEVIGRAKARVADMEAAAEAYRKLVDRQVAALVALAARWKEKDTDVAVRALRDALELRPGHAGATEALRALGGTASDEWTTRFDGRNLDAFDSPPVEAWRLAGGVLVGDATSAPYLLQLKDKLHGDFDLRVEMRLLKTVSPRHIMMLCGAMKGGYDGTECGLFFGDLALREVDGRTLQDVKYPYREPVASVRPAVDPAAWNAYELQFRGTKVRFIVNGTTLAERDRFPSRDAGAAGILLQDAKAEIRLFQVIQR